MPCASLSGRSSRLGNERENTKEIENANFKIESDKYSVAYPLTMHFSPASITSKFSVQNFMQFSKLCVFYFRKDAMQRLLLLRRGRWRGRPSRAREGKNIVRLTTRQVSVLPDFAIFFPLNAVNFLTGRDKQLTPLLNCPA